MTWLDAPPSPASPFPWLASLHPLDVYCLVVGVVMLVIALAQWWASQYTERRALRLFSVRYLLAAFGWFFGAPLLHSRGHPAPLAPMVMAVVLLAVTVWALDEFLGRSTPRRRQWIAAGAAAGAIAVAAWQHGHPTDSTLIFTIMTGAMSLCAWMAWQASRQERDVGHRVVALAFLSYPLLMLAVVVSGLGPIRSGLSYLIALPNILVGLAVLVVSLMRSGRRTEVALRERRQAERALLELNATLEHRVTSRTTELQLLVDGLQAFTRNVSHDLRGPLAGLAGAARLAREAVDQGDLPRVREVLDLIGPQAERLQALVSDLLTLSRVTDAPLSRVEQPLTPLVREALAQLALSPDTAAQLARVEVEVDPLPSAAVDSTMLRQVFINLIDNAIRFAAAQPGRRKVRVGAQQRETGTELFVHDDGGGFPPDQAARLFQPFVLLHGAGLSRNGVGLSIVRRVVERHGGRVWAESVPGRGATFWFSLGPAA